MSGTSNHNAVTPEIPGNERKRIVGYSDTIRETFAAFLTFDTRPKKLICDCVLPSYIWPRQVLFRTFGIIANNILPTLA